MLLPADTYKCDVAKGRKLFGSTVCDFTQTCAEESDILCSRFCDTKKSASFIGIEKDDEIVLVNGTEYGKNKLLCTSVDRFDPEGKRPIVFSDIEQLKCEASLS